MLPHPISTLSLGKSASESSGFSLWRLPSAMNVIPVLPANIKSITRIFPADERADVIPFESPTVPNADAASKKSSPAPNVPALSEDEQKCVHHAEKADSFYEYGERFFR